MSTHRCRAWTGSCSWSRPAGQPDVYADNQPSPFLIDPLKYGGKTVSISARAMGPQTNPWASAVSVNVPLGKPVLSVASDNWYVNAQPPGSSQFGWVVGLGLMWAVPVGMVSGVLCIATIVCGVALGTLFTLGESRHQPLQARQRRPDAGPDTAQPGPNGAGEPSARRGRQGALSAGFRTVKALYVGLRGIKMAQGQLRLVKFSQLQLNVLSWMRGCAGTDSGLAP